jgi:hypothetical protein
MRKSSERMKALIAPLETPGMIKQVETHLIFGPLSRHVPIAYLIVAGGIVHLIWLVLHRSPVPTGQHIGDIVNAVVFEIVLVPYVFSQVTRRQQALIAWLGVKVGFGFAAFMILMIGGFGGLAQGHRDALPALILGLIWIPGVEFIPKIVPHQKYVTIARLLLSIPFIYLGVRSGEWH